MRGALGRAGRTSLQEDRQSTLEELVVGSFDAPAPDDLQAALLGQQTEAGRKPPLPRRRIPGGAAAQRDGIAEEDFASERRLALDVARVGQVGFVVDGQ